MDAPQRSGATNGSLPHWGASIVGVMDEATADTASDVEAEQDDVAGIAQDLDHEAVEPEAVEADATVESLAIEPDDEAVAIIELPSPADLADGDSVEFASEPIDNADLTAVVLDVADASWVSNGTHDEVTVDIVPWPEASEGDVAADESAKRAADEEDAQEAADRAAAEAAWAEAMAAADQAAAEDAARADTFAAERAAAAAAANRGPRRRAAANRGPCRRAG